MKKLIPFIVFLFSINLVSAALTLTEVMYNPATAQGSDTSLEWIEIYNNDSLEDLSLYYLDGNKLTGTISQNEYIIIAKNLLGFESYYGNNDSVWNGLDGNYNVIESSISLSNSIDLINLTKQNYSEILNYSSSWGADGNGYTLQKIDVNQGNDRENWNESSVYGGTPGKSYEQSNDNQVAIKLEVESSIQIVNFSILDELSDAGFQIFPEPKQNKTFELKAEINSSANITEVKAIFKNKEYVIQKSILYKTNLTLNYYDPAGNYTINITAKDINNETTSQKITFEYLGLLSSSLSIKEIDFGKVKKGSYSNELLVSVLNEGNLEIDLEVIGSDLKNGNNLISASSIEIFKNDWLALSKTPVLLNTSIIPGLSSKENLNFRVKIPQVSRGNYQGNIEIITLQK